MDSRILKVSTQPTNTYLTQESLQLGAQTPRLCAAAARVVRSSRHPCARTVPGGTRGSLQESCLPPTQALPAATTNPPPTTAESINPATAINTTRAGFL
ncbi:hypothetical protein PTTG_30185 [Puccinia triticina 1-1 BBBD Race 1]|uniref:Uncharacterized protein n=1 Tax=Puccinia triticina (isolate 1-1 / race 1 (BBBD)) TaxID=630390 RepID=A0A180FZW9_PUCT1|nr:hypothetical protein PTTG_30185 [Puccinia triticina 1-1 BBBD Race 1]